ncbi:unnamed protein product [Staurois parvus]|uniref:Uncharacterized protein n=1 Tax=Staurois parvus TaxID=386267 RepID=A0ABN9BXR2_9NEOB|nr:unnamed protein product [Staurois parvus]
MQLLRQITEHIVLGQGSSNLLNRGPVHCPSDHWRAGL